MRSNAHMGYGALALAGLCLLLGSVANAAPPGKIDICHKPGERNQRILNINPEKDGPKHFGHGDYEVHPEVCDGQDSDCDKPINPDNGVDCSDGIACTVDTCAGLPGCFNTPDDLLCDDGDASTTDVCDVSVGGCVNTPVATVDILGGGTAVEGGSIIFNLMLNQPVPSPVTVYLASNGEGDDPATPGADFNPIPGSVVIAPNEVVTDFYVTTLDDLNFEPTESFVVRIQNVSNPHVIGQQSAVGFIVDNDQPICGNGTVEAPEQCDDGNTVDGDGCSASCEIEDADADGVTNLKDSGPGSLRQVLADIAPGGSIIFDADLAGGVIRLTSGQLTVNRSVTIDASAAPGIVVSGSDNSRVFEIVSGAEVSMNDLEVADGAGAFQGGGILNYGTLNLDRVVVRDNTETSAGPPSFDRGGGGIYNGEGATLNLTDSTVADNETINQTGGGVYGFFNSTVNITGSTISGNFGGEVAGGLRTLGSLAVANSTITGNTSLMWHGGAAFITDGVAVIVNSTITGNNAPAGTAGGLMVATFGAPVSVTVTNSIVANNGSYDCQVEGGGAASLESGGNNVFGDASCNPVAADIVGVNPLLGPLADYGGPTLTQALQPGSPAIDAANSADCPASDQRGVSRPQGAGCDVGAFELGTL